MKPLGARSYITTGQDLVPSIAVNLGGSILWDRLDLLGDCYVCVWGKGIKTWIEKAVG